MSPRKAATLEMAVLGLLLESPLHGYELRKRLNLLLGWTRVFSYGSLYPALKRMLRSGWIVEDTTATTGVSRRHRIVYRITETGTDHFASEMTDSGPDAWEDENFNMRFAFFSRTDAPVRLRILEGRRARLHERLDRARSTSRGTVADWYVNELHRHSIESVEREVRWLTDLIDAEHLARQRDGQQRDVEDPAPRSPIAPAVDPSPRTTS